MIYVIDKNTKSFLKTENKPDDYVDQQLNTIAADVNSEFDIEVEGAVCWDLGASTGGFTDCLLQRGARHVYAIDVGRGQLDWKLQTDERVTRIEGVNVRHLDFDTVRERPGIVTVDLSFISLRLILPRLQALAPVCVVALVIAPMLMAEKIGANGLFGSLLGGF